MGHMGPNRTEMCQTVVKWLYECLVPWLGGQYWMCSFRNFLCLCYDSSRDIRWNIAWALRLYFTVHTFSRHNTDTEFFQTARPYSWVRGAGYHVYISLGTFDHDNQTHKSPMYRIFLLFQPNTGLYKIIKVAEEAQKRLRSILTIVCLKK